MFAQTLWLKSCYANGVYQQLLSHSLHWDPAGFEAPAKADPPRLLALGPRAPLPRVGQ